MRSSSAAASVAAPSDGTGRARGSSSESCAPGGSRREAGTASPEAPSGAARSSGAEWGESPSVGVSSEAVQVAMAGRPAATGTAALGKAGPAPAAGPGKGAVGTLARAPAR